MAAFAADRAGPRAITAVILDLTVPGGMGGLEALGHLKATDPAIQVLVASGFSEAPVLNDPKAYGFEAVLRKPYLRTDLEAVLAKLWERR